MSEYDNEYTEQRWHDDADERERDQWAQDARELEAEPDIERDRRNPGTRHGYPWNPIPPFVTGASRPCRICGEQRPPDNTFLCYSCEALADRLAAEAKADTAVACCAECVEADCPDRAFGCATTWAREVWQAVFWVLAVLFLIWVVVVGWQQ